MYLANPVGRHPNHHLIPKKPRFQKNLVDKSIRNRSDNRSYITSTPGLPCVESQALRGDTYFLVERTGKNC